MSITVQLDAAGFVRRLNPSASTTSFNAAPPAEMTVDPPVCRLQ